MVEVCVALWQGCAEAKNGFEGGGRAGAAAAAVVVVVVALGRDTERVDCLDRGGGCPSSVCVCNDMSTTSANARTALIGRQKDGRVGRDVVARTRIRESAKSAQFSAPACQSPGVLDR